MSIAQRIECNTYERQDLYVRKSHPPQETDGKESDSDETLLYDMGLPTGCKHKMSSYKHMHNACNSNVILCHLINICIMPVIQM